MYSKNRTYSIEYMCVTNVRICLFTILYLAIRALALLSVDANKNGDSSDPTSSGRPDY
jgi:hypothetical protein